MGRRPQRQLDLSSRILHEDNHVILVNKLPSELVQGDKTGDRTLGDSIKAYLRVKYDKPGEAFLGVVHRLDRPTSGVVMYAKTSKALTRMTNAFRDREVGKVYWAMVENQPKDHSGTLTHWLYKQRDKNRVIAYKEPKGLAKKAVLHYEMIGHIAGFFLLEIKLETGRPHQIRAQLATIGCPITGDKKYGYPRLLKDQSIALHARSLAFKHPTTGEALNIVAPPPKNDLWKKFA